MPDPQKPVMRPYLAAAQTFASGQHTPRQFLEDSLALLEQWEPRIGAFVCTNLPAAQAAADRATARWRDGKPLSAIDGMPVGVGTASARCAGRLVARCQDHGDQAGAQQHDGDPDRAGQTLRAHIFSLLGIKSVLAPSLFGFENP